MHLSNSTVMFIGTATCAELKQAGMTESCMAQIYPTVEDDVWVYCDVDDEDGITVIGASRDIDAILFTTTMTVSNAGRLSYLD